jgi:putative cell wall-binding protein
VAGTDRYATAAATSRDAFNPGVPVVYVATGLNFPDALAGAAAGGHLDGPVLLTDTTTLPDATRTELTRLKPARIAVLGSAPVVSDAVARRLYNYEEPPTP